MIPSARRAIPAVEAAVQELASTGLPRPLLVAIVRRELDAIRQSSEELSREAILNRLRNAVEGIRRKRLQRIINATGIPLHTNFGRAPLCAEALALVSEIASGYNNLEYDLRAGGRGSRGEYVEQCLALLCGAEASTVVNNCAAALVLVLQCFTRRRREVIISRGEMVQIGGGFRIPEILESTGAKLREVGTTNRTTAAEYQAAIGPQTALLLKVHRSNFRMEGFVESAPLGELARIARAAGVPLVEDLGSGAVAWLPMTGGTHPEPTPAEVLRAGADLVCFSGDKLFGGPQAGIIAGRADLVQSLKRDPLFRTLRCDKLTFAALQVTAEQHLSGAAHEKLPALSMLTADVATLRRRAEQILAAPGLGAGAASVVETQVEVGGGTLPAAQIPSIAIAITPHKGGADALAASFRDATPAIIGYIVHDRLLLDLRTVAPKDDAIITELLRKFLAP